MVPEHWCPSTGTKCGYVQTLGAQNVRMFTFNKPSTSSLYSNRGDRNKHAFRVRYCCLIIAFYGFFTFLMLCLYMKHASDDMDYDHRRRLARIVTETCTAITRRLCVFLDDRNQVGGRAAWKIPRIQNLLEHEFLHFPDRKWLESYFEIEHSKELWDIKAVVCG